jgi:hypothetical protein
VASALRQPGVVRWLVLIQVCDLLLDILTGFVGLYLVDVVHATKEQAALGVAIRLGAGLAGDAVLIRVLERARAWACCGPASPRPLCCTPRSCSRQACG